MVEYIKYYSEAEFAVYFHFFNLPVEDLIVKDHRSLQIILD